MGRLSVALISNGVRLAQGNARYMGGNAATSGAYNAERGVAWSPGARRLFAKGEARVSGVTNRAAVPEGYLHPTCWDMPQKSGGMASRRRVVGAGDVSSGNLAGGLNAVAPLTGSGDITNAALGLILSAVADLTGSGALSAAIVGKLEAVAALTASGDLTAALGAMAGLLASLTGNSSMSANLIAKAFMSAGISVTGELLSTSNVGDAVFNTIMEAGFSYGDAVRILTAVAAGKTTIVPGAGATATVTFRDVNDTKDRVVADMDGSERLDVTLDGE